MKVLYIYLSVHQTDQTEINHFLATTHTPSAAVMSLIWRAGEPFVCHGLPCSANAVHARSQ